MTAQVRACMVRIVPSAALHPARTARGPLGPLWSAQGRPPAARDVARNRRARFDYEILETIEVPVAALLRTVP